MRLNRFLSLCGLGSRRGVEALIAEGQVSINGSYIRSLGTQVGDEDEVRVNGRIVRPAKGIVLALHKPKGYVCSRGDTHDRLTIYDLLPPKFQSLHHIGRLDKESEGLLLMTNRGDLSQRLMHPSEGVEKEYEVVVNEPVDPTTVFPKLVKGMMTEEGYAKAERVWAGQSEYRLHLVLKQGLKRQIRHMLYQLGFEVERLIRIRIGWLPLKGLPKGGWKELSESEVQRFFTEFEARPQRKGKTRPPAKSSEGRPPSPSRTSASPKSKPTSAATGRPARKTKPAKPDLNRPSRNAQRSSDDGDSASRRKPTAQSQRQGRSTSAKAGQPAKPRRPSSGPPSNRAPRPRSPKGPRS